MPNALRQVVSVAGGIVAALVLITAGDATASAIHPLPPGLDFTDREAVRRALAAVPPAAAALLVAGWAAGAGIGAWTAARSATGRRFALGVLVAGFVLVATIANLSMIPHPVWMWPAALLAIPLAGLAGARAGARGTPPADDDVP